MKTKQFTNDYFKFKDKLESKGYFVRTCYEDTASYICVEVFNRYRNFEGEFSTPRKAYEYLKMFNKI